MSFVLCPRAVFQAPQHIDLPRGKPLLMVALPTSLSARSFPFTQACAGQYTHRFWRWMSTIDTFQSGLPRQTVACVAISTDCTYACSHHIVCLHNVKNAEPSQRKNTPPAAFQHSTVSWTLQRGSLQETLVLPTEYFCLISVLRGCPKSRKPVVTSHLNLGCPP